MDAKFKYASIFGLAVCTVSACGHGKKTHAGNSETSPPQALVCPVDRAQACNLVRRKITDLDSQRDKALQTKDAPTLARVSLEINHQTEKLQLLSDPASKDDALNALESKYKALNSLLEQQLAARQQVPPFHPGTGDDADHGGQGDTHGLVPGVPSVVYDPKELQAVQAVFKDFGDLYINATPTDQEVKVDMPWAGYWYPFRFDDLFGSKDAPLAKLDKVLSDLGRDSKIADGEKNARDLIYGPDSWEGRCAAWATASVMSKEPKQAVTFHGQTFSISDQKALLTMAYEAYPTKSYGIRFDGDSGTDGTFQDLRPEAFHRIATVMLGERHKPFFIDSDPGVEVWSAPVYRYHWQITKDPTIANAFIVHADPWLVEHRSEVKDDLTGRSDRAAPAYDYRLYVDPAQVKDGKFKVIAGEWLKDAFKVHPDTVMIPAASGDLKSNNEAFNKNIDVVKQILHLQ